MADLRDPEVMHPLADMPVAVRDALLPRVRMRSLEPGDVLLSQGHDATTAYVILEGEFEVCRDGRCVASCGPGELVGVLGLFVGSRSTAAVVAQTRARVAEIDRVTFADVLEAVPEWSEQIREQARRRFDEVRVRAALAACLSLPVSAHDALAEAGELVEYANGDLIVGSGEGPKAWWLVLSGRAVSDETPPSNYVHGDLIGGERMLLRSRWECSVHARTPVVAVRWSIDAFEALVATDPVAIRQVAAEVLRTPRRRARAEARVVAVVTDGPHLAAPLAHAHRELGLGPAIRLAEAHAARELGIDLDAPDLDAMQEARLSMWLEERASTASLTLVAVPDPLTAWGRWALRVADRCLIVARTEGYRGPQVHTPAERHLVLLHPPSVHLPSGTRASMDAVGASRVSHLRVGRRADLERLARRLAGREIAVVFAGGGARGYVHLGVLAALQELGIPVDRAGGTSSGGIVAALAGRGESIDETLELLARVQAGGGPAKARVSASSLMDRGQAMWTAETLWEGRDVEDLWLPMFCVTANLDTAEATILESGCVSVATRATSAVPVAFSPVRVGEHWLVDGGIVDNYPVGLMRQRVGPGGRVIGVNLAVNSSAIMDREPTWFEKVVLRRTAEDPPHMLDVLYRSIQVATTGVVPPEALLDLELEIDATDVDPRSFDRYREVIELGLQAGREQLRKAEERGELQGFRDLPKLLG